MAGKPGAVEIQREKSLQEIGDALGLTRERVRQIEAQALQKVRVACEQRGIDEALWLSHVADLDRRQRTYYTSGDQGVAFIGVRIVEPESEELTPESDSPLE
jgi:hypothetical protein